MYERLSACISIPVSAAGFSEATHPEKNKHLIVKNTKAVSVNAEKSVSANTRVLLLNKTIFYPNYTDIQIMEGFVGIFSFSWNKLVWNVPKKSLSLLYQFIFLWPIYHYSA